MAEARPLLLLAIPVALGAKAGANAPNESAWILVALAALLLLLALAAGRVAARTRPLRGRPPSMTNDCINASATAVDMRALP